MGNQNSISGDELARLWIPQLIFKNTRMLEGTITNDEEVIVNVERKGDFIKSKRIRTHEILIFEGDENPLTYKDHSVKCFNANTT